MSQTQSFAALGLRRSHNGQTLDVTYFHIQNISCSCEFEMRKIALSCEIDGVINSEGQRLAAKALNKKSPLDYHNYDVIYACISTNAADVSCTEDAYLRLQLISRRLVKPHGISLGSIFGKLPNIAWTNRGPVLPEDTDELRLDLIDTSAPLAVTHVDKFPYQLDYNIPSGVRVAASSRVRLGAYLGEGTTVMQEGFINFNAGTEGNAMVEGRISAGVFVDRDTDIGGGASIMGTLSGGGKQVITLASKCLLGANSGTGISLGFGSTVAAGTYITAASKVSCYNEQNSPINIDGEVVAEGKNIVKGLELSGREKLLFLTDSLSGRLTCKPNRHTVELNSELHKND